MQANLQAPTQAWWKFGHVWLIIAGPAIVIVASFATLYLAITRPDPVLPTAPQASAVTTKGGKAVVPAELAPAERARNHATTGEVPVSALNPHPATPDTMSGGGK